MYRTAGPHGRWPNRLIGAVNPMVLACLMFTLGACSGSSGPALTPAPLPPPAATQIALVEAFPNLSFNQPLSMQQAPGDATTWYLAERSGRILSFANDPATSSTSTFASLGSRVSTVGEGGLLGLAFDPEYASTGGVFVSYTGGNPLESRVASFVANPDGLALDENSETILIRQEEPFTNHNIGHLAFGPGPDSSDQFLYVGLGDGGSGGDPNGNGQNPFSFHGTVLRIDVTPLTAYAIPPDNPFADGMSAAPEVFAFGFRNPWRFSFDRVTGDLWLGDVGQARFEEIDVVRAGGNFGWRCYEGNVQFDISDCPPQNELEFPVAVYSHPPGGASVIGGFVYRGTAISGLSGVYVFGDFLTGTIWGLFPEANSTYRSEVLLESGLNIVSFAEDLSGELYVLDFAGSIYAVVPGS
ncbi:MAG: glucose dehydrogenase [Gammaproteobacteria bacterium]|nr:glucose dehydrogenase [Gammaproteobacteria bacterium]